MLAKGPKRRRDLAPDPACADDYDAVRRGRGDAEPVGIGQRPQGEDAGEVRALDSEGPRPSPRGEEKSLERDGPSVLDDHPAGAKVDRLDDGRSPERYVVLRVERLTIFSIELMTGLSGR